MLEVASDIKHLTSNAVCLLEESRRGGGNLVVPKDNSLDERIEVKKWKKNR